MRRAGSQRDNENSVTLTTLKTRFSLSDAEAEVTLALADGIGLLEISKSRRVTRHTIRSQLKAIFHKTGARSQAQLVAIVLRS